MNDSAPRKAYVAPSIETLSVLDTKGSINIGGSGGITINLGGSSVSGSGSGSVSGSTGGLGS